MSVRPQLDGGDSVSIPSHELTVRGRGERLRLEWWNDDVHCRALFQIATDDGLAVLVSLGAWRVSQRGETGPLDWEDSLDRIPDGLLLAVRGAGYTPAEEGA